MIYCLFRVILGVGWIMNFKDAVEIVVCYDSESALFPSFEFILSLFLINRLLFLIELFIEKLAFPSDAREDQIDRVHSRNPLPMSVDQVGWYLEIDLL